MDFSIRNANQKDYQGICELFAEVDLLRHKNLPHVFQTADRPARTKKFISDTIADENADLFVALKGRQIIGLILVLIHETSGSSI
jgi:hypothetical protein